MDGRTDGWTDGRSNSSKILNDFLETIEIVVAVYDRFASNLKQSTPEHEPPGQIESDFPR
jgi:hypothetical protein